MTGKSWEPSAADRAGRCWRCKFWSLSSPSLLIVLGFVFFHGISLQVSPNALHDPALRLSRVIVMISGPPLLSASIWCLMRGRCMNCDISLGAPQLGAVAVMTALGAYCVWLYF